MKRNNSISYENMIITNHPFTNELLNNNYEIFQHNKYLIERISLEICTERFIR